MSAAGCQGLGRDALDATFEAAVADVESVVPGIRRLPEVFANTALPLPEFARRSLESGPRAAAAARVAADDPDAPDLPGGDAL